MLKENGVPDKLVYHIVSLFKRAPIPAYEKELNFKQLMAGTPCAVS
jgi:hypothetical protein